MSATTLRLRAHLATLLAPLAIIALAVFAPHRADAAQSDSGEYIRSIGLLHDIAATRIRSTAPTSAGSTK